MRKGYASVDADRKLCSCGHEMRHHVFSRFECGIPDCDCQKVEIKGLIT